MSSAQQDHTREKTKRAEHGDAGSAGDDDMLADVEAHAADTSVKAQVKEKQNAQKRGRKRRFFVRCCISMMSVMFFLALFLGVVIFALTDRDLIMPAALTKQVENRLNRDLGDIRVSIGQVVVVIDDDFIPRVSARNVGVVDKNGSEVLQLNSLRAVLSLPNIKEGKLVPDALKVSGAQIVVRRRTDGSFALDFGGTGEAVSAADIPKMIDAAFAEGPLANIKTIETRNVTISLEDARSQRLWQVTDVVVLLQNTPDRIETTFDSDIFNGTENLARIQAGFSTHKGDLLTTVSLNLQDVPALDLAQQSPALSFLSVLDAPISLAMRAQVDGGAQLSSSSGTLEIGAGTLAPEQQAVPLAFDGAKGYFNYDPENSRLTFPELTLNTDILSVAGHGHILLDAFDEQWPTSFIGQFEVDRFSADSAGLFEEPITFDEGWLDLKLDLEPFAVTLGQLALRQDNMWIRSSGRASVEPEGWKVAVDSHIDALSAPELMALWPESLISKTRNWLASNITDATLQDIGLALRLAPGEQKPKINLNWTFEDATVKFLKALPPVSKGAGYGVIAENELIVVLEEGHVDAPSGGAIDGAGSVVRIPNLTQRPAQLSVSLQTTSSVESALALLAQKPFDVLKAANFGPDVAQGTAVLQGSLVLPLQKGITLPDVAIDFRGDLLNVNSRQLVPGQVLSAQKLDLAVTSKGISIGGPVSLSGAGANATWSKTFGPQFAGASDITGTVTLNQTLLDTFNITLPKNTVSGAATGALDVALRRGKAPSFTVTSQLQGLGLSLPTLGVSKAQSARGKFAITGQAGKLPSVSNLSIEAAGFAATQGRVALAPRGGLQRLTFQSIKIGNWLDSTVHLIGQGKNVPAKVQLEGGILNLAQAPFGKSTRAAAGASGATGPIEIAMRRLDVVPGISLHNVRAEISQNGGISGSFAGLLNGSAPVTGRIRPGQFGPSIDINSREAGKTLMAIGLLEGATGGELSARLVSRKEAGSFDGAVNVDSFKVQSAPKMAELLSLISVVGLLEKLSGPGIFFKSLEGQFAIEPDKITIKRAIAQGPSLGVTAEGKYTFANKNIDLQGVVSPIYFLNAIGQVVSKKGEGLFGFNFGLSGPAAKPKVSVNPLSLLTPGALRGIFRKKSS